MIARDVVKCCGVDIYHCVLVDLIKLNKKSLPSLYKQLLKNQLFINKFINNTHIMTYFSVINNYRFLMVFFWQNRRWLFTSVLSKVQVHSSRRRYYSLSIRLCTHTHGFISKYFLFNNSTINIVNCKIIDKFDV